MICFRLFKLKIRIKKILTRNGLWIELEIEDIEFIIVNASLFILELIPLLFQVTNKQNSSIFGDWFIFSVIMEGILNIVCMVRIIVCNAYCFLRFNILNFVIYGSTYLDFYLYICMSNSKRNHNNISRATIEKKCRVLQLPSPQ